MVTLSFPVPASFVRQIDDLKEAFERETSMKVSRSAYIKSVLQRHIDEKKKRGKGGE